MNVFRALTRLSNQALSGEIDNEPLRSSRDHRCHSCHDYMAGKSYRLGDLANSGPPLRTS